MSLIKNTVFNSTLALNSSNGYELRGAKVCYNTTSNSLDPNAYVSIKIPLSNVLFEDEDFGVKILYTYNASLTTVNLPLSSDC